MREISSHQRVAITLKQPTDASALQSPVETPGQWNWDVQALPASLEGGPTKTPTVCPVPPRALESWGEGRNEALTPLRSILICSTGYMPCVVTESSPSPV